jgi:hypothetical protein
LQVVADRAASKHFGDFRNLGKSGPCADHTRRRTVDDTAVPEFGDLRDPFGYGDSALLWLGDGHSGLPLALRATLSVALHLTRASRP